MTALYLNDFSINKFYEYLVFLQKHDIDTKDIKVYNPTIYEDSNIIMSSNRSNLIQNIVDNQIDRVIIFSLDNLDEQDIQLLHDTTKKYNIPFIIL